LRTILVRITATGTIGKGDLVRLAAVPQALVKGGPVEHGAGPVSTAPDVPGSLELSAVRGEGGDTDQEIAQRIHRLRSVRCRPKIRKGVAKGLTERDADAGIDPVSLGPLSGRLGTVGSKVTRLSLVRRGLRTTTVKPRSRSDRATARCRRSVAPGHRSEHDPFDPLWCPMFGP